MLPDWAVSIASWAVVGGGLALLVFVAAAMMFVAVWTTLRLRDASFRLDRNAAARYVLWVVVRRVRRNEDVSEWVPDEVLAWAKGRIRRSLGAEKESR